MRQVKPRQANSGHLEGRSPDNYQDQGLCSAFQGAHTITDSRVSSACVLQPFRVQHRSTPAVCLGETRTAPELWPSANDKDALS